MLYFPHSAGHPTVQTELKRKIRNATLSVNRHLEKQL